MSKTFTNRFITFFIIIFITFIVLIFPVLAICQETKTNTSGESKQILTSTTMLNDMIKHLLGDVDSEENDQYQKIENIKCKEPLMGVGIDPHNYKTKLSDRNKIKTADFCIVNGLHLEAKMVEAFEKLTKKDNFWRAGEDGLDPTDPRKEDEDSKESDPHIWFDIDLWQKIAERLKNRLKETIINNDDDKKKLDNNFKLFKESLQDLRKHIIQEMTELKQQKETQGVKLIIVTAHDAFSYWEAFSQKNNCEFELEPIQGISTQTEASIQAISELATKLSKNNVKAIFTESSMPKDSLESLRYTTNNLRRQQGNKDDIIIPSEKDPDIELYSDSLGTNDKIEELNGKKYKHSTYVGAFLNNIKVVKENLL
ncbi:metal ABC transporter solute-binding protein, Zn/Mn family [Candidatus Phytoplasma fraxini]|uniref:Metal ABC transporter substrate binding protein (TroA) n=1 Tax=Ash yellows phytoplasma TaxID=35780 RepID=A0ABZ2U7Y2_ASHYP